MLKSASMHFYLCSQWIIQSTTASYPC